MAAIEKREDGTLVVYNNKTVIGKLIPWNHKQYPDRFRIQMGETGGFYHVSLPFDDALAYLMQRSLDAYKRKLNSIRIGATLIYKKKLKVND